jgi:outer membrane protein
VSARASYTRILATLGRLLSIDPTTRLELSVVALPPEPTAVAAAAADQILQPAEAIPGIVSTTLEQALSEAYGRRPELQRAEWSRRVAEARVRFERKGRLPSASLNAGFQYAPDASGFAVETQTWSIVANLALPIWDAGLSEARTRQAKADVAAAKAQLQQAKGQVAEEVRLSLTELLDANERRRSAAANTAQAQEALRIARVRYSAGLAPNVEVIDAQVALTQARANEVNAGYDYLASLANLNRSLGRYAGDTLAKLAR